MSLDTAADTLEGLENLMQQKIGSIHTCLPGTILSFDASTCLASVKSTLKKYTADDRVLEYPVIDGVPVFMPHAGAAQITYPVKAGDSCLIVFSERSIDEWLGVGSDDNHDPRQYDLTDGFCFVGMMPSQSISAENVEVINGGTKISLTPGNTINVVGNINVQGSITCSGDVLGGGISLIGHTHTAPHGETSSSH